MDAKTVLMIGLGVIIGPALSVIITPIFCLLRKMFIVPFLRKGLLEKAKRKGHIVKAHLVKTVPVYDFKLGTTDKQRGYYKYECNGKEYEYVCESYYEPGQELTLYYVKNPRKACLDRYLGMSERVWPKYYLLISVIMAVVVFVIGVNYTGGR